MKTNPDRITADYYIGAYGPTLRIEVPSLDHLNLIHNAVTQLKYGYIQEFKLSSLESLIVTGFNDLVMKRYEGKGLHNWIAKMRNDRNGTTFLWHQTEIGWENTEGLIEGLAEGSSNGHQYLTSEGDEVLVELHRVKYRLTDDR